MKRREFLHAAATITVLPAQRRWCDAAEPPSSPRVMTVTGEIAADQLGSMLPHEHMLVDFIGADQVSPDRYDANEAFEVMLPLVKQVKQLGCQTIAECTPAFLGRDPELLKRLSASTGMKFLTNTGLYGARQGKFLPEYAHRESAEELARRWTAEWTGGIEGTGVRRTLNCTGPRGMHSDGDHPHLAPKRR